MIEPYNNFQKLEHPLYIPNDQLQPLYSTWIIITITNIFYYFSKLLHLFLPGSQAMWLSL